MGKRGWGRGLGTFGVIVTFSVIVTFGVAGPPIVTFSVIVTFGVNVVSPMV